jgi:hypothetical protein
MKKNEFLDQYKDPRWQKKRLEIMKRDEFRCQVCGEKEITLNVHHRIYFNDKKIWEYEDNHLITLCENCHELAHIAREQIKLNIADIHEMFLSDYANIISTIGRFNPCQLNTIDEFLQRMFPIKKHDPNAEPDF